MTMNLVKDAFWRGKKPLSLSSPTLFLSSALKAENLIGWQSSMWLGNWLYGGVLSKYVKIIEKK